MTIIPQESELIVFWLGSTVFSHLGHLFPVGRRKRRRKAESTTKAQQQEFDTRLRPHTNV